jgi:hypothetical protein
VKDSEEETIQDKEFNFYEILMKLATKLDAINTKVKLMDNAEPDFTKEEFLEMFKKSMDESSDLIYNKLIDNLYNDSKFKELIISLIKSQFKELSS